MKKYKIIYWLDGNKLVLPINAENMRQAMYFFYMSTNGDIVSIEEVKDNV